ncbi:GNAT family N-acetyltransferase [Streptomyces sp. Isolate_45]|uniref:GNAT family N-acetyltransferase n=1 Tax=Streptomyces sp. Isolate_45 TaxID=2950111 RepID=UPI002481F091|nr:GNAT family N-acetyltransferase [Streptomyces sp. Isolate_45]MDA5282621.1 GNAT family N-acetyltransferase [Streptomyces sp. Isolate_45]
MTTTSDTTYEFRIAGPEDTGAIDGIDGSFTTATVFSVAVTGEGFALREVPVDPPLVKVFPRDDGSDGSADGKNGEDAAEGDSRTFVAVAADGGLAGFVAVSHSPWNRRLTIEDIEVAPRHRGRGLGRALMGQAVDFARERGSGHVWLEVTNINAPAIHAYRRLGFAFCGLDTTLYQGTESEGEHALYMSMPCP